jgi:hypothetical protein
MATKAEIAQKITALRSELGEIERQERREQHDALVGRAFKYRNCYSCPEGPDDYWPLYSRCIGVDDDGWLTWHTFETDKHGRITIEFQHHSMSLLSSSDEISKAEFAAAWESLKARILQHRRR